MKPRANEHLEAERYSPEKAPASSLSPIKPSFLHHRRRSSSNLTLLRFDLQPPIRSGQVQSAPSLNTSNILRNLDSCLQRIPTKKTIRGDLDKRQHPAAFSVLVLAQIATVIIVHIVQHLVCSTRTRTLLSRTHAMTVPATDLSRGSGRGYVTLIAGLDVPDGADTTSLFIHCPVSWFTLRGLLISWGLVPTGLRCGGGGCAGWLCVWLLWLDRGGGGTGGVKGQGHGLARLEGDGNTSDGLARLDNADKPPGLLRDSSSSGVPASPTLPRLSSEWSSSPSPSASPSPSPPSPMYLIHFFLRLRTSSRRLVLRVLQAFLGWVVVWLYVK